MANSTITTSMKEAVIRTLCNDEQLFAAIDPDRAQCSTGKDLLWHYLFPYHKKPDPLTTAPTFLGVTTHLKGKDNSKSFVTATLDIYVYTHREHLQWEEGGASATRPDIIAALLNEKFNGSLAYGGLEKLLLVECTEEAVEDYICRRLQFKTADANDPFREGW